MMTHERDTFLQTIGMRYGWGEVLRVTPQIGGYVAEVFLIETATHVGWLKCYDRERAITQRVIVDAPFYLAVTDWFHQHTALSGRITAPIPTVTGDFIVDDGGRYIAVMFDYIVGRTLRDSPMTVVQRHHLVSTVAMIHAITEQVPFPKFVVREDFTAPWARPLAQLLGAQWDACADDLQTVIAPYRDILQTKLVRFVQSGHHWRNTAPDMVLCHTDIHGHNTIVSGDTTVLLDFEGLKLAPPEHDFMFWINDDAWPDILASYHTIRPGVTPNLQLIRFYQERRLLEDVYDYLEQLVVEPLTPAERAQVILNIQQMLAYIELP